MADFELSRLIPEILISLMACTILILAQTRFKKYSSLSYILSLFTLIVAGLVACSAIVHDPKVVLEGMFIDDAFANLIKFFVCILTAGVFFVSRDYVAPRRLAHSEYYVLGLFSVVGMMILASANHLLSIYLGLELMSLCLYAMVAFQRDSANATEAAMKYFVLGAIGSGSLLYGLSIIYGLTGTLEITAISIAMSQASIENLPLILALVFVVTGLAFKLGAAPFHMWVPDVYHGAPTATTIFLGTAPKIAAFAMVFRLLIGGLDSMIPIWQDILIIVAILSIAVGNIIAIAQENIKRMLAYSAIAHMGFMLLGVLSGTEQGYSAALFYVLIYSVMNLCAFGIVVLCAKHDEAELIADYRGLNRKDPWMAGWLLVTMFSLAGIPPTAGFFAKLVVIQALIDAGFVWIATVAVILAVIGAFYYLRVIKVAFFEDLAEDKIERPTSRARRIVLGVSVASLLFVFPWVGDVISLCTETIQSFL